MSIPRVLIQETIEAAAALTKGPSAYRQLSMEAIDDGIQLLKLAPKPVRTTPLGDAIASLESRMEPLQLKSLIGRDSKVAIFGDGINNSLTSLVQRNLPELKQLGFAKIGVNSLDTRRQPLIDAFMRSPNPGPSRTMLGKAYSTDTGRRDASPFLQLMDSAKAQKMEVFALKKPFSTNEDDAFRWVFKRDDASRKSLVEWTKSETVREPNKKMLVLADEWFAAPETYNTKVMFSQMQRRGLNPVTFQKFRPSVKTFEDEAMYVTGHEDTSFALRTKTPNGYFLNVPPLPKKDVRPFPEFREESLHATVDNLFIHYANAAKRR